MAQTGYTPISIYYSTTASAAPTAGNLVAGELAINTNDGKLFYKDSSGVVQTLATKGTAVIGGSDTQVQYNSSGSFAGSSNMTFDGTKLTVAGLKDSALTSGRVTYATTSGELTDSANLTFNGTTLTTANGASIQTLTVGLGGGSVSTNTALGVSALTANTTGASNVAVGQQALVTNTFGNQNVAIGRQALLSNTTGANNTAVGYQAGYTNAIGTRLTAVGYQAAKGGTGSQPDYSTAVGAYALTLVTTGTFNTAVGDNALGNTTTGGYNSAFGQAALQLNTTGVQNTAIGWQSLYSNTTGVNNTAVGYLSLNKNTFGNYNAALGQQALYNNTTASNNTAVGYQAGLNITTGSNNVCLGQASGTDALVNITTASNNVVLGNNSTTTLYCKTSTITTSDRRDKTNIRPVTLGLDFVNAVEPVAYQFKVSREDDTPASRTYLGWIAQDVQANQGQESIVDDHDPENLKMAGMDMVAVLWKSVQELSAEVKELKAQLAAK